MSNNLGSLTYLPAVLNGEYLGSTFNDQGWTWDRAWAIDINGDGKSEVVLTPGSLTEPGNSRTQERNLIVLSYDGNKLADMTESMIPSIPKVVLTRNFVVADFNGDNVDDLLLVNHGTEGIIPFPGEQNRLFLSNGAGVLVDHTSGLPQLSDFSHSGVAADFDGDGDIDLFINNLDPNTRSYLITNDGSGNFSAPNWLQNGGNSTFSSDFSAISSPYHPEIFDQDADGIPDIYFGRTTVWITEDVFKGFSYAHNDGLGNFTLVYDEDLGSDVPDTSNLNNIPEFTEAGDLDKDGDLDLIVYWPIHTPNRGTLIQYLRNDGVDGYTDVSYLIEGQEDGALLEATAGAPHFKLVDLDADGDLDIALSLWNEQFTAQVTLWFSNDGAGNFSRLSSEFFPASQSFSFADVNGDWIPDATYAINDWDLPPTDTLPIGTPYASLRLGSISESVVRSGWDTNDRIAGGTADDTLSGLGGNDQLNGNSGNDKITGGAGNDEIHGGAGIDTAYFSSSFIDYTLRDEGSKFIVESLSGTDGLDSLFNVERLNFSDIKVAIDLDGNAGTTAKVLGAVFGASSITNQEYIGIGIDLLDSGMSYETLMELALNAAGVVTNEAVVQSLYTNVIGSAPTSSEAALYVGLLDSGMSKGALGVIAADHALNVMNIDLVGLAQTGIEYV